MRAYEIACVFRSEEDSFQKGCDAVRAALTNLGAVVDKENDMGQRTLAYEIRKQIHGHFLVFDAHMTPDGAHQVENAVRLVPELLRILVVRKSD